MLRQAQHERSHGLFTTRKFAFSLAMPLLNRSPGASQNAILTIGLEPHDTPTFPFALSMSKGGRELRNSHPFARTSTGSARTEPRPRHHTKVRIQHHKAPNSTVQPFASHSAILTVGLETHKAPYLPFALGPHKNANLTVRLELVERWTGAPQLAPIPSYFDRLSTNGATASSPHEISHAAS